MTTGRKVAEAVLLEHVKAQQYTSARNLDARIALHRRFTPVGQDVLDFLWTRYVFTGEPRILDIGCGTGEFWLSAAAHLPNGGQLTLADRSIGMISRTRLSLHALPIDKRLVVADLTTLPFEGTVFDVTLAHFMLYHASDKVRALHELKRVAKPQGWLGIVLTAHANMSRIVEKLVEAIPETTIVPSDAKVCNASTADPLIRSVFRSVRRDDYEYTMNVTDPSYVVAYAKSLSSLQAAKLTTDQWQRYTAAVSDEIRTRGAFDVVKSSSLFLCRP